MTERTLQEIGKSAYECVKEMVEELRLAREENDDDRVEDAERAISEDPLSVQVRSDWVTPGTAEFEPVEYEILLSTGGPATRIVGDLDEYCQPDTARLEAQDWFRPWGVYHEADEDVLLDYVREFYFGG